MQSAEPPLADDPKAAEKLQLAMAQRNPPPVVPVRGIDSPSPAVVLRVQAPAALPVGQDVEVRLVVENLSHVPAKNVSVVYALQSAAYVKSQPAPAEQPPGAVAWKFDTLGAGGRQEIVLTVKPPPNATEFESKARVIVDQEQTAKTKFSQASLKVAKTGPKQALQFDILVFGVTVTNPGELELRDVIVTDKLPAGLVHRPNEDQDRSFTQGPAKATAAVTDEGQTRTWKIDRLAPKESRRLEYHVFAATAPPGQIKHQVFAQAGGGVQDTATDTVELVEPKMDLKAEAPPRKSANVPATLRITLTNTGPRLLQNILVTDLLDPCKLESVGGGGQTLQNRVQWIVPSLGPNRSQVLELSVSKADGGVVRHKVSAVYRGLPVQAEAATEFEAVAALAYDFHGSPTTVEVNGEVVYEITLRNSGSAAATNIRPVIQLPPEVTLVKAEPENKADGGKVVFEPIPTLPPNGRATFRVTAKAIKASVGARATAELSGDPFPTGPVTRQEMTAIGASPAAPMAPTPAGGVTLPVPVPPPDR
jgi:uncharacterized repeat protein (TIGR01451 family)